MKLFCEVAFKFSTGIANDNVWKTIGSNPLFYEGVPNILSCFVTAKDWRNLLLVGAPTDRIRPILLVAFDIFDFYEVYPDHVIEAV